MMKLIVTVSAIVGLAASTSAQTGTGPTLPSRTGGLSGPSFGGIRDLGSTDASVPDFGSIGASNTAGLLDYCIQNNLLDRRVPQAGDAGSVLQRLAERHELTASSDYRAGRSGHVVAAHGPVSSLNGFDSRMKSRACRTVLGRAKSFL